MEQRVEHVTLVKRKDGELMGCIALVGDEETRLLIALDRLVVIACPWDSIKAGYTAPAPPASPFGRHGAVLVTGLGTTAGLVVEFPVASNVSKTDDGLAQDRESAVVFRGVRCWCTIFWWEKKVIAAVVLMRRPIPAGSVRDAGQVGVVGRCQDVEGDQHRVGLMECKGSLISDDKLGPKLVFVGEELPEALHELAIFDGAMAGLALLVTGCGLQSALECGKVLLVVGDELIGRLHP